VRWPSIAFVRCFAHDINNLVKQVLKTLFRDTAREAAAAVNALNASSAKWLCLLQEIQLQEDTRNDCIVPNAVELHARLFRVTFEIQDRVDYSILSPCRC